MNKWLIASHDAGGAEVVSAWVHVHSEHQFRFVLQGPAKKIFERKLGAIEHQGLSNLDDLVLSSDHVLTGTSWASDLEKEVIRQARSKNVRVSAYLDHWVNYKERFRLQDKTVLPDEIWVGDTEAFEIAKTFFPEEIVRLEPNQYFCEIQNELKTIPQAPKRNQELRILYVSEPVLDHSLKQLGHPNHLGYTEYQAIEYFLKNLDGFLQARKAAKFELRIRLHPSESRGKYDEWLKRFPHFNIVESENKTIIEDCVWSDMVVGCESMAMVVGLLANREVFCTIPPEGPPCRLPQKPIKRF